MPPASSAPRGEKAARNSKEQTPAAPPSTAPGAIGLGVLEIPTGPIPGFIPFETTETDASKCVLSGQGLHEATVRQATYFWIQAVDVDGKKKTSGGDIFFCAIRGPAAVAHSASYALCMPCLIHVLTIVVVPLLRTSEHIIVHFPGHAQARRELDHLHRRLEVLVTARAEGTGVRIGVYGGRRRCADWRASVRQRRHSLGQLFGRLGPSRPA